MFASVTNLIILAIVFYINPSVGSECVWGIWYLYISISFFNLCRIRLGKLEKSLQPKHLGYLILQHSFTFFKRAKWVSSVTRGVFRATRRSCAVHNSRHVFWTPSGLHAIWRREDIVATSDKHAHTSIQSVYCSTAQIIFELSKNYMALKRIETEENLSG